MTHKVKSTLTTYDDEKERQTTVSDDIKEDSYIICYVRMDKIEEEEKKKE